MKNETYLAEDTSGLSSLGIILDLPSEVLQAREKVDKMSTASPALPWDAPAMALV